MEIDIKYVQGPGGSNNDHRCWPQLWSTRPQLSGSCEDVTKLRKEHTITNKLEHRKIKSTKCYNKKQSREILNVRVRETLCEWRLEIASIAISMVEHRMTTLKKDTSNFDILNKRYYLKIKILSYKWILVYYFIMFKSIFN